MRADANKARAFFKGPGLSLRLLLLTFAFVLLTETLIFFPSVAGSKLGWLNERVEMAETAILAVEAAPKRMVSDELSRRLLENAHIVAVAMASDIGRESILSPAMAIDGKMVTQDLRAQGFVPPIGSTLQFLLDENIKFLRVLQTPMSDGFYVEVVVEAAPLRQELLTYANNILWLSLLISLVVGLLIYLSLVIMVVRPIRGITSSLARFRDNPKDWRGQIHPSKRSDEIGIAERTLSDMETTVRKALNERERLAQLGEAMAKINHDLRNSLTAAQLVSDGLSMSEDPRVKRAAPRLERSIERAITLAEDTLEYGRMKTPEPKLADHVLHTLVEEAAYEALTAHAGIVWHNSVDETVSAEVDADHIHRIILNLLRNAAQAITEHDGADGSGRIAVTSVDGDSALTLHIMDNGPGIPERVQETLFKPFSTSGSRKGSGLGLAIAKELATGMGGDLRLLKSGTDGTLFELILG